MTREESRSAFAFYQGGGPLVSVAKSGVILSEMIAAPVVDQNDLGGGWVCKTGMPQAWTYINKL